MEHRRSMGAGTAAVWAALGQTAEEWNAGWRREGEGGRLELPVVAGLRYGVVEARVRLEGPADDREMVLEVETEHYRVHRAQAMVLVLSALGGILFMLWPFLWHSRPELSGLMPAALVLAIGGWLLIAARLHNRGPEDFLEAVGRLARPEGEEGGA